MQQPGCTAAEPAPAVLPAIVPNVILRRRFQFRPGRAGDALAASFVCTVLVCTHIDDGRLANAGCGGRLAALRDDQQTVGSLYFWSCPVHSAPCPDPRRWPGG